MMVNSTDVIASARVSWQCNYTIATARWRLTQLHGLYQLLIDRRDDIVELLSKRKVTNLSSITVSDLSRSKRNARSLREGASTRR